MDYTPPAPDTSLLVSCIIILFLLLVSAFFSAAETAMMAASRPKLHSMEKDGHTGAKRVNRLIKDPELLLGTILLGNTLVNMGASAITTGIFIDLFGESGIAAAALSMTFLVLVFSEVLPKTLASRRPDKFAIFLSIPMLFFVRVLQPFTWVIALICRGVLRLFGVRHASHGVNFGEEDVRGAIGMGLETGVLEHGEHRMLDSILQLDDVTVEDVMVHRGAMMTVCADISADELYARITDTRIHSRLPVWQENPDNIIGILHVKDFYPAYFKAKQTGTALTLSDILHPAYFVPETAGLSDQLKEFRRKHSHMALVVDEYGDIKGLVTLEDIIEEIVGDIEDEHDRTAAGFVRELDGSITLKGSFPVRDANREFGWELPDEDAVSVAGLIIEELGRIPTQGEEIVLQGLTFRVLQKTRQAVVKVSVRPVSDI